ncbi:hypothetical protein KIPB_004571, partial [Kipferlia bialata]|eukprot:g4571.t1
MTLAPSANILLDSTPLKTGVVCVKVNVEETCCRDEAEAVSEWTWSACGEGVSREYTSAQNLKWPTSTIRDTP